MAVTPLGAGAGGPDFEQAVAGPLEACNSRNLLLTLWQISLRFDSFLFRSYQVLTMPPRHTPNENSPTVASTMVTGAGGRAWYVAHINALFFCAFVIWYLVRWPKSTAPWMLSEKQNFGKKNTEQFSCSRFIQTYHGGAIYNRRPYPDPPRI